MKWRESETMELLELYKYHECLWDINNPNYKNRQLRESAYEEILNIMARDNFGISELRQKIKNLRSTYNHEVIKIKKASLSNGTYVPNLKWFQFMDSFLHKTQDLDFNDIAIEYSAPFDSECEDLKIKLETKDDNSEKPLKSRKISSDTSTSKESKKIRSDLPRGCHYDNKNDIFNENRAFGRYVTSALNKMPSKQCLLAQRDIQNLLVKYRLADEQSDPINVDPTLHKYQADGGRENHIRIMDIKSG